MEYDLHKNDQCGTSETKDPIKGEKKKPISRMKELLRWAASDTTEIGWKFNGRKSFKALKFRRRGTPKAVVDDDQLISDSPKISFIWDAESSSTDDSLKISFKWDAESCSANDSPNISFKWDAESCSTTSSAESEFSRTNSSANGQTGVIPSPISIPPEGTDFITCRKWNWITTDSEFVVLEL